MTTNLRSGPGILIHPGGLVTPVGAWALVVPAVHVVAPFMNRREVAEYAEMQRTPEYRVLPFLARGVVATL
ncbi:hypothetical protein ACG83_21945 [Frankia sp. R43]|nr:hypothetical protein ACG83_21945 [Frankia sp. R43]